MMLRVARWTQPDFAVLAKESRRAQLYNELARWAMDITKTPYNEHGYAPGAHILPTLKVRLCGEEKVLSKSSKVQRSRQGTAGAVTTESPGEGSIRGGATSVPLAVLPSGEVLTDSWTILNHYLHAGKNGISTFEQGEDVAKRFRRLLDEEIGPLTRQVAYWAILKPVNADLWNALVASSAGWAFYLTWRLGAASYLTDTMRSMFGTDDDEQVRNNLEKLEELFERIERDFLPKKGYLGGDNPAPEDFALAALAAPVVLPREYCRGKYNTFFDELQERDKEFAEVAKNCRKTAVGKHCVRMFALWRERTLLGRSSD